MGAGSTLSRTPPQAPIIFDATPSSLIQDAQALIDRSKILWDSLIVSAAGLPDGATFDNTIRPIIDDENVKLAKTRGLRFYASTSPSKELREASHAATTLLNGSDIELLSRADVFVLVDAVARKIDNNPSLELDDQSKYYVQRLHRAMRMNGCAISDPSTKDAFDQTNKQMKELGRKCLENIEEDSSGIWLALEELDGVPQDYLEKLPKGDGDNHGKLWLKLKPPGAAKVMSSAYSEATRKKVYYARCDRLPQNVHLFRELVLSQDTTARLLGFPHYLAYKTSQKMAQTPEAVTTSLENIEQRIRPAVLSGVNELLSIKAEKGSADSGSSSKLFLWDESYYNKLRNKRGAPANDADLAEYFELYHTLDKLLSLFGHLFDTRFERITTEQQEELAKGRGHGSPFVWHEDVMMYAVWDMRDSPHSFVGYAYFDLFPREGKYGHRGNYTIQWGYEQPDGKYLHPSVAFVMNYTKPRGGKPTLLDFESARQMFHELGHLHHSLLTRAKYASLSAVDRDFGEAPSIMFEQFFSNAAVVKDVSYHYSYLSPEFHDAWQSTTSLTTTQPPMKLTDSTSARLVGESRLRTQGYLDSQAFNLALSLFDVQVHSPASHEELEAMDLAATYNKIRTETTGLQGGEALGEGWAWSQGQSVFRMIISGYDAGYYTYVLGRVYALDMWKQGGFAACDGLEQAKEPGRRFRDGVLAVGGRQPEMLTLTRYLGGRAPSTEAYFQWLGV
ncbi:hypothetical protein B0H67DRAFT_474268 [Lasiosphaeris hirsuta]|uniref:Peptidase M3A/M3B catalytic domain-containing protein n=1 Tax=Lasiosphaeris hirsuta TaxID=260670 RepID=A0AA40EBC4_9PEZI|nr:hypothetical protein B0H67DRAFT_474268 [Lasiosphaeris hirsuta]